jgi:NADPH:quinone reductase-like Zn-dependent oxidoreductase
MAATGALTTGFPAIIGSDFSGIVLETGEGSRKLEIGDTVFGMSGLGRSQYSPFQDTLLVDEDSIFKKSNSIAADAAATLGVAALVGHCPSQNYQRYGILDKTDLVRLVATA